MSRKNSRYTDFKWNSKKRLKSARKKMEQLSYNWGELDFYVVEQIDDVIAKIDEIEKEIDGINPKKF